MTEIAYTFRQAQSAYDLISLVQATDDERLIGLTGPELLACVRNASCRFDGETDAKCYETVASIVLDGADGADLALAILIANDLQRGAWSGDVIDFAEMATTQIRSAEPKLRGAILRGLDCAEELAVRYTPVTCILPNESRVTVEMDQVVPRLCDIARGMDVLTRQSIANSDYGDGADKHLAALDDVLSRDDCLFANGEHWYPGEVVELVAYVRSTPGFVSCTALLLVNEIFRYGRMGWFDYRWKILGADYNALPPSVRAPILAGIRYLYEADGDYVLYSGKRSYDPVRTPERMIQYVD